MRPGVAWCHMQKLYEDEHIECLYVRGSSKFIVLAYAHMHSRPNGQSFWGSAFFQKAGYSAVGITAKSPNWYPEASIAAAREAVLDISGSYANRISYGYSMGAYAALKYGRTMRSELAIAFAPQVSISPHDVGQIDRRYVGFYNELLNGRMLIEGSDFPRRAVIFHDPFERLDVWNFDQIKQLKPDIMSVKVPSGGHDCIRPFARTGISTMMFELCNSGDVVGLATLSRKARRSYAGRLYNSLRVFSNRRPHDALRCYPALMQRFPDTHARKLWAGAAISLMQRKDQRCALAAVNSALALGPPDEKLVNLKQMIERLKQ